MKKTYLNKLFSATTYIGKDGNEYMDGDILEAQQISEDLLKALENVTASLDNVLLHQGKYMTKNDLLSRKQRVKEAEAVIKLARKGD